MILAYFTFPVFTKLLTEKLS